MYFAWSLLYLHCSIWRFRKKQMDSMSILISSNENMTMYERDISSNSMWKTLHLWYNFKTNMYNIYWYSGYILVHKISFRLGKTWIAVEKDERSFTTMGMYLLFTTMCMFTIKYIFVSIYIYTYTVTFTLISSHE